MRTKKDYKSTKQFAASSWVCILSGAFLLAAYTVICALDIMYNAVVGVVFLSVYTAIVVIMLFANRQFSAGRKLHAKENIALSTAMSDVIQKINIPFTVTDENGKIIWYNDVMGTISGRKRPLYGVSISDICQLAPDELAKNSLRLSAEEISEEILSDKEQISSIVDIDDKKFEVRSYEMKAVGKIYYLSAFSDVTALDAIRKKVEAETPVVAYVVIDNLEELAQYVRVSSREAANEAENVIKAWSLELNALMREYDRDKFIIVFEKQKLLECVENKFEILERIRNIRLGDNSMPITVSIGISYIGEDMADLEHNAQTALDMALQRGGDQVALRGDDGLVFFGGRTKNIQKRTKVLARVIANQLLSLIATSGNVLIMGHRNPDFDSIGACVGVARLCMHCGVSPKIILNTDREVFNKAFGNCSERLLELDAYKDIFISSSTGMDLIRSDTLLIVVDANNFKILEEPSIAENIHNFVIIDHHRKTAELEKEPAINYIDPSASSACELVTELLEQCLPVGTLTNEESTVMLSGIMVDTQNFTRSTGVRTFAAALYLRGEGGNSEIAHTFFNEDFNDFSAEAKFGTNVMIYRDTIAITTSMGSGSGDDRTAASKAADKLLTVKNVDASFALVPINNVIHISARSNGAVNVQLILEELGGGGHFNIAGAQIPGKDMRETLERLKAAIDNYLDNM
ncbi:MAG: DHH family phosphoesterase [Clostridia bacterium]|nr:DHH family phosphoesterase [Clostridia bacterium]